MPGIVGNISAANSLERSAVVDRMLDSMLHEPSYRGGTVNEEMVAVTAGFVVHGGSFSDCLPIWNESRDVCLLFVGESYADTEELNELARQGHVFEKDTADYLVHLYEERGEAFLRSLNGIFSGLLLDLRQQKVVLFNDRYGLGRIYFHAGRDGFFFASEAKAILKVQPHLRQLDMKGLGEYFACGCVLQNRSLFPQLSVLPPASAWTFQPGMEPKKETYFNRQSWENQAPLPEEEYYHQLRETFSRVLPRYFRGSQQIAMSLTGGLDGRMIMAWADHPPGSLPCYSHRGMVRECADARIARRVATVCGQPHREVTVDQKFLSEFRELAARTVFLSDGTMEVHGATGLYVNRIARTEIAPVRMTGNYGGEVLRGVVMLGLSKLKNPFFSGDLAERIEEGVATYKTERQCDRTSFILCKQVPWHHYSRFAVESSQLSVRSPYLDNDLVALAFRAPRDLLVNQQLAERLIKEGNAELASFPTDRGPLGRQGLAGRLAERYQEFTFKADYAFDYGMPHWLTRIDRVFQAWHLERFFLGRHKYYHFRYWYRHQLAEVVKEVLLDPSALSRPYLNRKRVEEIVLNHVTGRGNYTLEIHSLLSTEFAERSLIRA